MGALLGLVLLYFLWIWPIRKCRQIFLANGRSGAAGVVLGLFLGLIGWFIASMMFPIAPTGPVGPPRACPFCAEPIQAAAIVCKHCGRDVEPLAPPSPKMTSRAQYRETLAAFGRPTDDERALAELELAEERARKPWWRRVL